MDVRATNLCRMVGRYIPRKVAPDALGDKRFQELLEALEDDYATASEILYAAREVVKNMIEASLKILD